MTIKKIKHDNQIIWYDEKLISVEQAGNGLDINYWQSKGSVLGSAQGRGTTWFVQTGNSTQVGDTDRIDALKQDKTESSLPAALRHYQRGGLFGKLIHDSYYFSSWENTRSYQEFVLLQHLRESGVNVPKPIAARATKHGLCYKADLLSEQIPNASDLVSLLEISRLTDELYFAIGQMIDKMHTADVNHTDLNIHNILVDKQQKVWIIDFDKCYIMHSEEEKRVSKKANLDRLQRSFVKEVNKRQIHWQPKDWSQLINGYQHEQQHEA